MEDNLNKQYKWISVPPKSKISKEPFLKGKPINILKNNEIEYVLQTQNGKCNIKVNINDAFNISNVNDDFEDMCKMSILNEP